MNAYTEQEQFDLLCWSNWTEDEETAAEHAAYVPWEA